MRRLLSNDLALGVGYCLTVVALDWVSTIGIYRQIGVSPWVPAAGLTLAFAYGWGLAAVPFVVVGELLSALVVNPVPLALPWKIVLSGLAASCWLVAALALRKSKAFDGRLRSSEALLALFLIASNAALAHALFYLATLWSLGLVDVAAFFPLWWRLLVGNLVGILVVAPLAIMLQAGWRPPRPTWLHLLQFAILALSLWAIFSLQTAANYQLFYLLFLPMIWIALRDGVGGAAIMLNVTQIGIIFGTQSQVELFPGTGSLQVLLIALAMTGLLVGAIVSEREDAARRLHEQTAAFGRNLRLRSAGETAAAIAHQINQPITAISTYAGVARDSLANGDHQLAATALAKLTEQCDRAASVMRSIRDLVKQGTLNPSSMRVQKLLLDLRATHATECAEFDIKVDIDAPNAHHTLLADAIQIEQALDNLVTNSIEAIRDSGKPGQIRISSRQSGGETHIEVEDNGPGFASGLEEIATTPFMTTKINGSGLGLAIARSVAEAHGGSLAVINRKAGASVRLRLPTTGTFNGQENHQHH